MHTLMSAAAPAADAPPDGAIVVDARDDEPLSMPSACMKCFKNVRGRELEGGVRGGGAGGGAGGRMRHGG